MISVVLNTQKYFQPSKNAFWRWENNGEVASWQDGNTICYRDDLINILKECGLDYFPPLSPILLLLSACREDLKDVHLDALTTTAKSFGDPVIDELLYNAIQFLLLVTGLPASFKKGKARIHLVTEVFADTNATCPAEQVNEMINELSSGRLDAFIINQGADYSKENFIAGLKDLATARSRFGNTKSLQAKLATGIHNLPIAPVIDLPATDERNIFAQLADDARTEGVEKLAKKLIAALNIPMHSMGTGDLPLGGIADISNRGNYDKLLLSELAHDDISFTARLVNNEALYYRREDPPHTPRYKRIILTDVTLRMWGLPRIFSLSAALACANNTRHKEEVVTCHLGGETVETENLASKEGILKALETLYLDLHCGKALQDLLINQKLFTGDQIIFITDADTISNPDFYPFLAEAKLFIDIIITVNRNGELRTHECIKGQMKLIAKSAFDLDEFFGPEIKPQQNQLIGTNRPAFLNLFRSPLLFAKSHIKKDPARYYIIDGKAVAIVNSSQRLLLIREKEKGAVELMPFVEKAKYVFGTSAADCLHFIVSNNQVSLLKFYKVNLTSGEIFSMPLWDQINHPNKIFYLENYFCIENTRKRIKYDCELERVTEEKPLNEVNTIGYFAGIDKTQTEKLLQSALIDTNYCIMYKVKKLYIDENCLLVLGNYHLEITPNNKFQLRENNRLHVIAKNSIQQNASLRFYEKGNIKFYARKWEDGSEAILDSRGLLHLKSGDPLIPETTMILVTGSHTACWASTGQISGNPYFFPDGASAILEPKDFYNRFISPFLNHIYSHA